MKLRSLTLIWLALLPLAIPAAGRAQAADDRGAAHRENIQLGVRPFFLIEGMDEGPLKSKLQRCENGPFKRSTFSISHRGAPLQFPEHTLEGYEAAARQGAGIVECDVTFTKDGELVCRHAECDLHTTTNIVATELNNKCSALQKDSDMYLALDTLAQQVRIRGIFADWPATVTYYANCMGLE